MIGFGAKIGEVGNVSLLREKLPFGGGRLVDGPVRGKRGVRGVVCHTDVALIQQSRPHEGRNSRYDYQYAGEGISGYCCAWVTTHQPDHDPRLCGIQSSFPAFESLI